MNLVDSCGWLEYFADGHNADFFAPKIEDAENLVVPTICIAEVFKRVLQERGERAALQAVALMQQGHVKDLDAYIAMSAARTGAEMGLPLADSVVLATARAAGAVLWTQDAHFKKIKGVKYKARR